MSPSESHWLRRIARFLIRGPDALHILDDLDDGFDRDISRGLTRSSARRRYARNVIGSTLSTWRAAPWRPFGGAWLDVKLGVRLSQKQPMLTLVAVFTLAIGIPAGLLPLHIMDSITAPLPVEDGDDIVRVWNWDIVGSRHVRRPIHDWVDWRGELSSFENLGMGRSDQYNVISDDGRAGPVRGAEVTASVFALLRVPPMLGRALTADDEAIDAPNVVVIGHDLWQSRLAGDPDVVGRTVHIGTVPWTVVGVMPEGFLFPYRDHLWLPFRYNALEYERGEGPDGWIMGRLADGVAIAEARRELTVFGRRMALEFPDTHGHLRPQVLPYTEADVPFLDTPDSPDFLIAEFLALVLLALACANIGILVLARAATRTGEIAIRTALGAGRARIVSQIFVESLVLAVVSAGAGLLAGQFVASRFDPLLADLPFWVSFDITGKAIVLAVSLAVLSAVIAGVVPALKATGKHVQPSMQRAAGGGSGVRFGTGSNLLIVAEVAVAVLMLSIGSTLVPTAVNRSGGINIESDRYLSASLHIPRGDLVSADTAAHRAGFQDRLRHAHEELNRRLAVEPGVGAAAIASALPGMSHRRRRIEVEGEPLAPGARGHPVRMAQVDVGYFRAFDQPILHGRDFSSADLGQGESAVVVNTAFVDHVLGGRQPLGQRIRYAVPTGADPGPWYGIVGVVGHLGMNQLNPDVDQGVYHPVAPGDLHPVRFAMRVEAGPGAFIPRLRSIAAEIDASAMIHDPMPLDEVPNYDLFLAKWGGVMAGLLSAITVVLSAAGLYALMSFTVSERRVEIGIRSAHGGPPTRIVATIAKRAFGQLVVGVTVGAGLSSLLLSGVKPGGDVLQVTNWPVTVPVIALGVLAAGMLACVSPTRRGLRIRVVEALKS